ncbi:olfactory receptor 2G3-like [Tachyglossus aculeatus]|uniref:olfactory receptor 2G3-like n=1 Tax=Tachyglossus aculeatus TaxID=9261 RepID=UPI0018F78D86|nr:olfactory receptor 2G3-like [Tachyglossus aculeatus]
MEWINASLGEDFILIGFSNWPGLEMALLGVVPTFYFLALVGNLVIILVSLVDPHLQTPMYLFLSHLSFLDLCLTTSITPMMLANLHHRDQVITHRGCIAQLYTSLALGCTECAILAVMAYDRYLAVCQPLRYVVLMPTRLGHLLTAASWSAGFSVSLAQTTLMLQVPLCGHRWLDHFFCELPVILQLACCDARWAEAQMFVARVIILVIPTSLILVSYGCVARAVLRVRSVAGRHRAFGTCGSHLTVVSLFFGPAICVYLQPTYSSSQEQGKFVSLFYTVVTPLLNPLTYTLRNKEVKEAMRRLLGRGQKGA